MGRPPAGLLAALTRWCSRIPLDYPSPENSTARGDHGDFSAFQWGGDEAFIVAKGSPWPQELARVLATLIQGCGIAARLAFLYRGEPPALHCVVETWLNDAWAVFDPCANKFYLWPHHGYASALAIQQQPALADHAPEHGRIPSVDSAFYATIAIAAYGPEQRAAGNVVLQPVRPIDLPALRAAAAVFALR